ncbi:MAG: immunoglobulin domain-containing protein [Planctomycetota bacterium]|jgi:hypothetical protein
MNASRYAIGLSVAVAVASWIAVPAYGEQTVPLPAAAQDLLDRHPGLMYHVDHGRIKSFFGRPITVGDSAVESAEQFRLAEVAAFGVSANELRPESLLPDKRYTQPLMYDRDTGNFKFTAVYYAQYHTDIPVFKSDMRLLVRNEDGFPLVMAKSYLKPLGGFQTDGIVAAGAYENAVAQAMQARPELAAGQFTQPTRTIWAGYDEIVAQPVLAIRFEGIDRDVPASWLFVADATTGQILYDENRIYDVDIEGSVRGIATEGTAADICEEHSLFALPYAWVGVVGGNSTFADEFGDYVIPHDGTSQVTVRSEVRGPYFRIFSQQGAESVLELPIEPPGPVNITHNAIDTEINRSQVDAYIHQNVVRDYLLDINPEYPVIDTEEEFTVNVNKVGGICPNNAQYIASDPSTNYCLSAGAGPNMAWSVVVYHEYGHHVVEMGGSGQCAYGEGMSDCLGILVTDESGTGFGFLGDCDNPLRDGDNECQYSASSCTTNCGGPCHNCGRLLSGCVWSTRTYLLDSNPDSYRQIIGDLTLNSIPLHSGSSITPQITIDFLMLDDNDANLDNGSPHYPQICQGFNDHSMQCPELPLPIILTQPDDSTVCQGEDVTFRVASDPSFDYQWFKNSLPIAGGVDQILFITDAQDSDEGEYYCEVTNEAGTIPTEVATLTVVNLSECEDGDDCTADSCSMGVCESTFAAPDSTAVGSRSIALTPEACNQAVAILVTSGDYPCLSLYVQEDGTLSSEPVFQDPAAWSTVTLRAAEIVPGTQYTIQAETMSGQSSVTADVTTWLWGDVNDNLTVNFEDVLLIVNVFQGDTSDATVAATDLEPCLPNGVVNLADVQRGIQAFQQISFPETGCALPCP